MWVIDSNLGELLDQATWLETSAELCNLGWQIKLVSSGFPLNKVDERIQTIRLPRPKIYLLGHLVFHLHLLYAIISEWQTIDIIMFHQFSAPFLLPLVLIRNLFGQKLPKLILDSRDLAVDKITIKGKLWVGYFRIAHVLADLLADGQTAITIRMAHAVRIPTRQLLGIWPSGVRTERFSLAISSRHWSGETEPLRLIYIGSFNEQRNLIALCQAVRLVLAEGLGVTLTFVGKGPLASEIEKYCIGGNDGGIFLKPAVPYSEVVREFEKADVGVLPFLDLPHWQIASFIKMFEYLAAGMPILATRIVSHTDVLADAYVFWARDGSVDSLAEAIRDACAKKANLSLMGAKAAAASHDWTWERSARKLDGALRKALDAVYEKTNRT